MGYGYNPLTGNLDRLGAGGGGGNPDVPSGLTWNSISASQAMAANSGYVCVSGAALSLSLPTTAIVGQEIQITLAGATSFTITQGAGQSIRLGNVSTTAGVGGSLTSTAQGDTVWLVCIIANTRWGVFSSIGNLTIV